jgi:hypothetical protein
MNPLRSRRPWNRRPPRPPNLNRRRKISSLSPRRDTEIRLWHRRRGIPLRRQEIRIRDHPREAAVRRRGG